VPLQTDVVQSEASAQPCPEPHAAQVPPPQSVSVSLPFLTPSAQVGAWHVLVVVPVHTPLAQSLPTRQTLADAQVGQVPPPQSTSVSAPFFTTSAQVGVWHTLPVHLPLWQSPLTAQALPLAQSDVQLPPQSMSVSVPFLTPSVHPDAWQLLFGAPVHTPLTQSPLLTHA
jgi:hypothetical protein